MKKLGIALIVLLVVAGLAAWVVWQRAHEAPEAARLLPDADAIIYLNFRPLHLASLFASLPKVDRDPEYDKFVQATGFEFERDLHEAAIAVHLPGTPAAAGAPPAETRFSEVFIGNFDVPRIEQYFRGIAKSTENYRGRQIYTVPVEGRTVRLALLSEDTIGISNVADAGVVHGIVDRARQNAFFVPYAGPQLVREHYGDVPFGSLAWALTRPSRNLPLPSGFEVPLNSDVSWVASVRYAGDVQLEAQAIAPNPEAAKQVAESLSGVLQLTHALAQNSQMQGHDADVKNLFDSLQVRQDNNKAVVSANVSLRFLQKLASGLSAIAAAPEAPKSGTTQEPKGRRPK